MFSLDTTVTVESRGHLLLPFEKPKPLLGNRVNETYQATNGHSSRLLTTSFLTGLRDRLRGANPTATETP